MKTTLTTLSRIAACLALALASAPKAEAAIDRYSATVSVTDANSAVTPAPVTSTNRPGILRIFNDGAGDISVRLNTAAVFGAATTETFKACEGREYDLYGETLTSVNIIANTGLTATARVSVSYYTPGTAQFAAKLDRVTPIKNENCRDGVVITDAATTILDDTTVDAALFTVTSGGIVRKTVTLTEAGGAELVATFTSVAGQTFGFDFHYTVRAADATPDYASRTAMVRFVCTNNATAVTCTKDGSTQADDESVIDATNSKTLTYAVASDVATANVNKITFNIDSDMTSTSASISWFAIITSVSTGGLTVS